MSDHKKIAFVINSLGIGGAEHVVKNLSEYFHKEGKEVLLVTSRTAPKEYEINFPVKRILLEDKIDSDFKSKGKNPPTAYIRMLERISTLRKIWLSEKPDIIVSFIGKMNIYTMLSTGGLRNKIKVFLSVRSDPKQEYPGLLLPFAGQYFKGAAGVIFQTKDAAKAFPDAIRKKSAILQNALDESFTGPAYEGPRDNRIVMVGRLDANKNHKMVMNAFAKGVRENLFDLPLPVLEFYGDSLAGDNTVGELKALARDLKIDNSVIFMGRQDNIRKCIESASLFILASNYEGMPNALLEAMATGLPAISTDCPCGGPATVIKNGENGILIPVGDGDALLESMIKLWNNKTLRDKLGKEASKIKDELTYDNVCRKWSAYLLEDSEDE